MKEIIQRNRPAKKKEQASKPKRYRGKETQTKTQGTKLEAETYFKGQCSDQEGYIFNIEQRESDKCSRTMKDLERYLGETYNNICEPAIMPKTPENSLDPEMQTIIPDMGVERPKTNVDTTYLKNNNIDEAC